ncbi:MAG: glycosyltransferase [Flavobacterium sp.]|nr:glycosyltransferase [Flavobacterium sp.]
MKILFISMPSIHAKRWIDNLQGTNHEIFWFNILNKGTLDSNSNVIQIVDWQKRKIPKLKGEYFLLKKFPKIFYSIQKYLEVSIDEQITRILKEINPDVVHSFEMQSCSYPILKTMNKFPNLKWIYSCWGSDLYYYQNFKQDNFKIKKVLKRVNFLQTDCKRDLLIAKELGFIGVCLDVIPGGTGFKLNELANFKKPISDRKIILVKGYQHQFGRALNVVKALEEIQNELIDYKIVIFAAHNVIVDYVTKNNLPFQTFESHSLSHEQVLDLMGQSLIYIGNSISDGIPNTMLESIVMGAFPIQSNPGGATAEIIINQQNGLLIGNPENTNEIKVLIQLTLSNAINLKNAFEINQEIASTKLDFYLNQKKVLQIYEFHNSRN